MAIETLVPEVELTDFSRVRPRFEALELSAKLFDLLQEYSEQRFARQKKGSSNGAVRRRTTHRRSARSV
ncbi:MAG: hypothetical protein HQ592_00070 [Planctomycetes bacterium]|jgi:hypothetical protein|nr:hypothetical protein [Planctomycetota bacterium]